MSGFLTGFADELIKLGTDSAVERPEEAEAAPKRPSLLRRALPVALGAAGAAAVYRYGRRVKLSKNPELSRIQRASKGRLTHIEALDPGQSASTGLQKFKKTMLRGVDDVIEEPAEKWQKRYEHYEYPAWHEGRAPSPKARSRIGKPERVQGAVMTMGYPSQSLGYKGDLNLTKNVGETLRLGGSKIDEAAYVNRSVKGAMPETKAVKDVVTKAQAGAPKSDGEALDAIQAELGKRYPKGYVIKPVNDAASGGVPTHKDRFANILAGKGNPTHQDWMSRLLKSPDEFLVQEYIPIKTERALLGKPPLSGTSKGRAVQLNAEVPAEWRSHVVGGQVIPNQSVHRWATGKSFSPAARRERKEMEAWLQDNIDKLPKSRKGVPMAVDVGKDAQGNYKIIELNAGGESNFLRPDQSGVMPGVSWGTYKTVTGRSSRPEAALMAVGGGLGLGGTANIALRDRVERQQAQAQAQG